MNFEIESTFKNLNKTAAWFTVTLSTALILKILHGYSETSHLEFILWPISKMASLILNKPFYITEAGMLMPAINTLIDKSYSGGNFFLFAFCIMSWSTPHHLFTTSKSIL